MLDIPSISAVVATIGVLVGVAFAYLEVRSLVRTRQTDLVVRLFSTFGSKEFQEAYEKVVAMDAKDFNEVVTKGYRGSLITVGVFFEGIGVLLRRKLVDIGLVYDLFRQSIKMLWETAKPVIEDAREQLNQPRWGEWFEYLYNETQKREQRLQQIQQ